jgi:hypothetical protein
VSSPAAVVPSFDIRSTSTETSPNIASSGAARSSSKPSPEITTRATKGPSEGGSNSQTAEFAFTSDPLFQLQTVEEHVLREIGARMDFQERDLVAFQIGEDIQQNPHGSKFEQSDTHTLGFFHYFM